MESIQSTQFPEPVQDVIDVDPSTTDMAYSVWSREYLIDNLGSVDDATQGTQEESEKIKKRIEDAEPYLMRIEDMKRKPYKHLMKSLVLRVMSERIIARDPLKLFLKGSNVFASKMAAKKKGVDNTPTHTSLAGGVIFIETPQQHDDFYRNYGRSAGRGTIWTLTERPTTACMRLMVDLDFKGPQAIFTESIEFLVQQIQAVVVEFFPTRTKHEQRVVVCGAPIKLNRKAETTTKKTGVHLVWPELYLSARDQLQIRYNLVVRIKKIMGARPQGCNRWDDVIDPSIYTDSGLRLIGTSKVVSCPACNAGKTKKPIARRPHAFSHLVDEEEDESTVVTVCPICSNRGRVEERRPYLPMMILDGSGERHLKAEANYRPSDLSEAEVKLTETDIRTMPHAEREALLDRRAAHFVNMVQDTHIRVHPSRAEALLAKNGFATPADAVEEPDGKEPKHYKRRRTKKIKGRTGGVDLDEEDWKARNKHASMAHIDQDLVLAQIKKLGQMLNHSVWDMLTISEVLLASGTERPPSKVPSKKRGMDKLPFLCDYFVSVIGLQRSRRFCCNINDYHSSNGIYFNIGRQGGKVMIVQRCHKKDDNSSRSVSGCPCNRYTSRGLQVTDTELLHQLYPHLEEKAKETARETHAVRELAFDHKGNPKVVAKETVPQKIDRRYRTRKELHACIARAHKFLHLPEFSVRPSETQAKPNQGMGTRDIQAIQQRTPQAKASKILASRDTSVEQTLEGVARSALGKTSEQTIDDKMELAQQFVDVVAKRLFIAGKRTVGYICKQAKKDAASWNEADAWLQTTDLSHAPPQREPKEDEVKNCGFEKARRPLPSHGSIAGRKRRSK